MRLFLKKEKIGITFFKIVISEIFDNFKNIQESELLGLKDSYYN
jgi:hypothetical protein